MSTRIADTMKGLVLPGNSTVELRERSTSRRPGHGEVLIRTKSSTICGSDIRCIYHQHLGKGPEGYQPGMIAGHEPCGPDRRVRPRAAAASRAGDRVIVYHISGCGVCNDCRRGYMISCTSHVPPRLRLAARRRHGRLHPRRGEGPRGAARLAHLLRRRAGGLRLRHRLRGHRAGRRVRQRRGARHRASGRSASRRPCWRGPWARRRSSASTSLPERLELARRLGLFDAVLAGRARQRGAGARRSRAGHGVERAFDCSASDAARLTCIQATRKWGRICFLGEGGTVGFQPSRDIIHDQKTIYGSWVTTIWRMEELVERLVRWNIHPETLDHPPLPAGPGGRRVRADGERPLRQGGGGVRRGSR